jgi:hypothetical protein
VAQKAKTKARGHRIFTGVAGEYFVAAELSRRGAVVTITSKNTPDVDILASNSGGTKLVQIQVKAGRNDTGGFIIGSRRQKFGVNTFYVFVLLKGDAKPEYWIIPYNEVRSIAEHEYNAWLRKGGESRKKAPVTLRWKHLKTDLYKYHDSWKTLGILS